MRDGPDHTADRLPQRRQGRALLTAMVPTLAAVLVAGFGAAPATAAPQDDKPQVKQRGDAYMGWSMRDKPSTGTRTPATTPRATVAGMDVSGHQGDVN